MAGWGEPFGGDELVPVAVTVAVQQLIDAILGDDVFELLDVAPLLRVLADATSPGGPIEGVVAGRWTGDMVIARAQELHDLYNPPEELGGDDLGRAATEVAPSPPAASEADRGDIPAAAGGPAQRIDFWSPSHQRTLTLVLDVDDVSGVEHPECGTLAEVAPELDVAFCSECLWQTRISGAWYVEMVEAAAVLRR